MAEFCKPCSIYMFGSDFGDIVAPRGHHLEDLCERCGYVVVDDRGDHVPDAKPSRSVEPPPNPENYTTWDGLTHYDGEDDCD